MLRKQYLALVAAIAAVAAAPSAAQANRGLVTCHPGAADNYYTVGKIVTNQRTGCQFARHFAAAYQRASWNGQISAGRTRQVSYKPAYQHYRLDFRINYRVIPVVGTEALRVQAFGEGSGLFVSFMTTQ